MNQFFAKAEKPLTFSSPLSRLGNTISIPKSTALVDGYLAATDFATFSGKENVLSFSSPLSRTLNAISLLYNATNLKITSNSLNTIQDIATSSSPTFKGMNLSRTLTIDGESDVDTILDISGTYNASVNKGLTVLSVFAVIVPPITNTKQTTGMYGYVAWSGINWGVNSAVMALDFGIYNGTISTTESVNLSCIGMSVFASWGYANSSTIKLAIGGQFKALNNGLWNDFTVNDYTCALIAKDNDDNTGGSIPNQIGFYAEKPTRGTRNYQIGLAGNGAGTGIWFNAPALSATAWANYARIYAPSANALNIAVDSSGEANIMKFTKT